MASGTDARERPAGGVPGPRLVAVAAPIVLATLMVVAFAGLERAGVRLFVFEPANIAEAAGLGIGSETLRRLERGEDPTGVLPVRAEILSSRLTEVSALEAAVFVRKAELIRMIDTRRPIIEDELRRHLLCLAYDAAAGEIIRYLERPGDPACRTNAARALVEARAPHGAS